MSRRQRLEQVRLAEARVHYLHSRCAAGLAGLRSRFARHRVAWLVAGGFGAGMAVARVPAARLLALAATTARVVGIVRVPLVALVAALGLQHERNDRATLDESVA